MLKIIYLEKRRIPFIIRRHILTIDMKMSGLPIRWQDE